MNEHCTLNYVPANKMATLIDKYVSNNDVHGLELFFDMDVFKKSYYEVKKQFIDQNLDFCSRSYKEASIEIESKLREKVKEYLNK